MQGTNAKNRYCWRAISELRPGMVLARPVLGQRGGQAALRIASGARLTSDSIGQLLLNGVECAAVYEPDPAPLADPALHTRYEARLREIFGNSPAASCQELFAALLKLGPCTC